MRAQGSVEYLLVVGLVILVSAVVITAIPAGMNSTDAGLSLFDKAFNALKSSGGSNSQGGISGVGISDTGGDGLTVEKSSLPSTDAESQSSYSGGDGNCGELDTDGLGNYYIDCCEDLYLLSADSGKWGLPFIVTQDIDCAGVDFTDLELKVKSNEQKNSNLFLAGGCYPTDCDYGTPGWVAKPLGQDCWQLPPIHQRILYEEEEGVCSWQGLCCLRGFTSIGSDEIPFTGTFDGGGHSISNLEISGNGMFGVVDGGGVIENLTIENANYIPSVPLELKGASDSGGRASFETLSSSENCTGGAIAKILEGFAKDLQLKNLPTITKYGLSGHVGLGGLVGCMYEGSELTRSWANINVNALVNNIPNVGGLVGKNYGGVIEDCNSRGDVNGSSNVGGLVGLLVDGNIKNSFSDNDVNGYNNVGGLVGRQIDLIGKSSHIIDSTAYGNVLGDVNVNCLVGSSAGVNLINSGINCNSVGFRSREGEFIFLVGIDSPSQTFSFYADNARLDVNWGDGTIEVRNGTGVISHSYAVAGDYNVSLNGYAQRIAFGDFNGELTPLLLKDIYTPVSDGVIGITDASFMFAETNIASFTAKDFFDSTSQNVTNMSYMFAGNFDFNQDLSGWDTGNVTNMSGMFVDTISFNQDLSGWDTGNVTDMSSMFASASAFNQDIGDWNTAKVANMSSMFSTARAFNQSIGGWDTGNVTDMSLMFYNARDFNQDLGGWDTGNVTTMAGMFRGARAFNQSIGVWDTGNVTNMSGMFVDAVSFNQDLSGWDTGNVTTMVGMFRGARAFNQSIGDWNTAKVTNMREMFAGASAFNQDVGGWDTSKVTFMQLMFAGASAFNQDVGGWDTGNVTNMSYIFRNASAFNQDLSDWNVSKVVYYYDFNAGAVSWILPKPEFSS